MELKFTSVGGMLHSQEYWTIYVKDIKGADRAKARRVKGGRQKRLQRFMGRRGMKFATKKESEAYRKSLPADLARHCFSIEGFDLGF